MSDADKRQLKIKAGVVRRVRKELGMYKGEAERETAKVEALRAEGADPHDIKYAVSGGRGGEGRGVCGCSVGGAAAAARRHTARAPTLPPSRRRTSWPSRRR